MSIGRRRFVQITAGLTAGSAVGGGIYALLKELIHRGDLLYGLTGIAAGSGAFARIGELYLAGHPHEAARHELLRALGLLDVDVDLRSTRAVENFVHAQILTDLENDDLVSIEGWLLTRTEARLFSLGALEP